eukprot:4916847-Pyramimonas_sp.AAC.1
MKQRRPRGDVHGGPLPAFAPEQNAYGSPSDATPRGSSSSPRPRLNLDLRPRPSHVQLAGAAREALYNFRILGLAPKPLAPNARTTLEGPPENPSAE